MGYDYNECVICYLFRGGNVSANIMNICAQCIENHYDGGNFGRVLSACTDNISYADTCELCKQERIFLFAVGVCNGCKTTYELVIPVYISIIWRQRKNGRTVDIQDSTIKKIINPTITECRELLEKLEALPESVDDPFLKAEYGNGKGDALYIHAHPWSSTKDFIFCTAFSTIEQGLQRLSEYIEDEESDSDCQSSNE